MVEDSGPVFWVGEFLELFTFLYVGIGGRVGVAVFQLMTQISGT